MGSTRDLTKDHFIYDSGSQPSVCFNKAFLLGSPQRLHRPRMINGVIKAGAPAVTLAGTVELFEDKVLFSEHFRVNILSASRAEANPKLHVEFLPRERRVTHKPSGKVMRFRLRRGLYVCNLAHVMDPSIPDDADASEDDELETYSVCSDTDYQHEWDPPPVRDRVAQATTAELRERYTKKELDRADEAEALVKNMGYPSERDVALRLKAGLMGSRVVWQDFVRARAIFGKQVGVIKGKTVRRKKRLGEPTETGVTPQRTKQVLNMDIFFVMGFAILVAVASPLGLSSCVFLDRLKEQASAQRHAALMRTRKIKGDKDAVAMILAVRRIFGLFRSQGYEVARVHFDGEPAIAAIADDIRLLGAELKQVPSVKVPEAERRIRVIEERCRCIIGELKYSLPPTMVESMVAFANTRVNQMISLSPLDNGLSPYENFVNRRLDFKRDFPLAFGDFCYIHEEGDNTMKARARQALYLGPSDKGDHKYLALGTWLPVNRPACTTMPGIPLDVIETINLRAQELWAAKGVPRGEFAFLKKTPAVRNPAVEASYERQEATRNTDSGTAVPTEDLHVPPPDNHWQRDEHMSQDPEAIAADDSLDPASQAVPRGGALRPAPATDADAAVPECSTEPDHSSDNTQLHDDAAIPRDEKIEVADPSATQLTTGVLPSGADHPTDPELLNNAPTPSGEKIDHDVQREPLRRSGRNSRPRTWYDDTSYIMESINNIAEATALRDDQGMAVTSMLGELGQMHSKSVFHPVHGKSLTKEDWAGIIPSSMFLKAKYSPDDTTRANPHKIKSRLVAGGHRQDRSLYETSEISSPTVQLSSAFLVANIAAREKRKVATADIRGAYLNARMKGPKVLMKLDGIKAALYAHVNPDARPFLRKDGSMIVQLDKALYGCLPAGKLWFDDLVATLKAAGYVQNPEDICTFNKTVDGVQCTVIIYVDDLLITSISDELIDELLDALRDKYKELTTTRGLVHQYLGMTFDFGTKKVSITMHGCVKDCLDDWGPIGSAKSPGGVDLFEIDLDSPPLTPDQAKKFHSRVAKLLYLSKRVRPDLLTAVGFLTTRVLASTDQDMRKLNRVLAYLKATKEMGIRLESTGDLMVFAYIDASHGVHIDGKSRTGTVITLGRGAVHVQSEKQKLNTKSSTESELVALTDGLSQVIWTRNFLEAQGYKLPPAKVFQDNMSTIALASKGKATAARTRHISIRYFFAKDRVESGDIAIEYMPTSEMIADIMTKPLQGQLFYKMRQMLMNWEE